MSWNTVRKIFTEDSGDFTMIKMMRKMRRAKLHKNSELRIKDVWEAIDYMCPKMLYINGKLAWDDNKEDFRERMTKIYNSDILVYSLTFVVDDYHHSIVFIEGDRAWTD